MDCLSVERRGCDSDLAELPTHAADRYRSRAKPQLTRQSASERYGCVRRRWLIINELMRSTSASYALVMACCGFCRVFLVMMRFVDLKRRVNTAIIR